MLSEFIDPCTKTSRMMGKVKSKLLAAQMLVTLNKPMMIGIKTYSSFHFRLPAWNWVLTQKPDCFRCNKLKPGYQSRIALACREHSGLPGSLYFNSQTAECFHTGEEDSEDEWGLQGYFPFSCVPCPFPRCHMASVCLSLSCSGFWQSALESTGQ